MWGLIISTNGSILTKKIEYKQLNNTDMEMEKRVGYEDLVSLCQKLRLDPKKEGDHKLGKNGLFIIDKPLILETTLFPGENQTDIFEIGNRLRNLFSQTKNYSFYNYASKRGREEAQRDSLINKILSIFGQLVLFYFCTEAKIDGHIVYHGIIYKVNLDEEVVMAKARQLIEELKKEFSLYEEQQQKSMG